MNKQSLVFVATLGACLLVYAACGSDEPSGSSPTITAPTPQSPANGSTVQSLNPTLTVGNAVGAASLRCRFEVATDSGFSNIVAAVDNVPEGSGSTSWRVTSALATGRFFWRARAATVAVQGPFSSAASFDVEAGFNSRTPVNDIYVSDPLTTGMSVGEVSGGEFRAGGWFATDASSYIRYEIPTTPNGFVEFQVTNLRNPNPRSEKRNLMIMWDPTRGDYTENPFRVHIAKFDTNLVTAGTCVSDSSRTDKKRIRGSTSLTGTPTTSTRFVWNGAPFRLSSAASGYKVLMDGREIMTRNYDNLYQPSTHWVELGMGPRNESLEQALYSNVTIGVRRPNSE